MPSMSRTSPAKKRLGRIRLLKCLKLISFKLTPPAVTNSSLKVLLPFMVNVAAHTCWHNALSVFLSKSAQRCSGAVSYTHLRAHETVLDLVCRLLLEKKKIIKKKRKKKRENAHTQTNITTLSLSHA